MLSAQGKLCQPIAAYSLPVTRNIQRLVLHDQHCRRRKAAVIQAKAQQREGQPAQEVDSPQSDAESARIAELEGRKRRRKGKGKASPAPTEPQSLKPQEQGFADWPEGQLLPNGWEEMSPIQKAGELWSGKRGALFWANRASWASLFIIGGAWVLFRVIGPLTGLYTLKNDLLSPPNL